MRKLELLSPAGDIERLKMAVLYGADAVYLAGTDFGMRAFAGNFTPEELPQAVKFAHDHGVKAHVTVNIMPRNDEIAQLPAYLERLVHSLWPESMPPAVSGIFPPSSPSPTTNAPRPGSILAQSVWFWQENALWTKCAPSARR